MTKSIVIVAAAFVPLSVVLAALPWIVATLGVVVVTLEGIQQLNQFHENWIRYRTTCQALTSEKALYGAKAAQYSQTPDPDKLLAERTEEIISREHGQWQARRVPLVDKDG